MNDDDSTEQDETKKKVTEICESAIEICHNRVHQVDKKNPLTIEELRKIMFIVREAHYLTNDDNELFLGDLGSNLRNLTDEDEEDEDDDEEDEDFDDDDDDKPGPGPFRFGR